jgi:hypothetical protein
MKYAAEMGSGAMIHIPSFIKTGSSVQKLIGRICRHTAWRSYKPPLFFQHKESRLKIGSHLRNETKEIKLKNLSGGKAFDGDGVAELLQTLCGLAVSM